MVLLEEMKDILKYAESNIKKCCRKIFMGKVVSMIGRGGQRFAEKELKWNRGSIRKGQKELLTKVISNKKGKCGRKKAEEKFPSLLQDIVDLVDPESQADPKFQTKNLYPKVTAKQIRKRLIEEKGYVGTRKNKIPSRRTINEKLNQLGYKLRKVQKKKPLKKIAETDAIFEKLHEVNKHADNSKGVLRLSMDAKAKVKIGAFARGGKNRKKIQAIDHDFESEETLTPWGIQLPNYKDFYLYFTTSKVTSDFIVDCLEDLWPTLKKKYNPHTLVINLDNGMENCSHRTQFIKRIVDFAYAENITIHLAYYPPYHSKYNPIERTWGILEQHWNGEILDSKEKILALSKTMTWRKKNPIVKLVDKIYKTGVTLSKDIFKAYENMITRLAGLEKWFIMINH